MNQMEIKFNMMDRNERGDQHSSIFHLPVFHRKGSPLGKMTFKRKTQNSGVIVKGDEESGERGFFGVLREVIELQYDAPVIGGQEPLVPLFQCHWFDFYSDGKCVKKDNFDTISVNIIMSLGTNKPFALASQVDQVYYVRTYNKPNWRVTIRIIIPRNFYHFPNVRVDDHDEEGEDMDVGA